MLRSFLIYLSKAEWARRIVTRWAIARRAALRFVAGETLDDAIQAVRALNQKGINATLDHLGEHTHTPEAAMNATQAIQEVIQRIVDTDVRANVSIKLTQIGLGIAHSLAENNLRAILTLARKHGIFVRIDMEDSTCVDTTLGMYHQLHDAEGFDNCGVVIQSYLYRSEADVSQLLQNGTRIRLCKGAYKEPAEVAFPKKSDVDSNYDRLTAMIIARSVALGSPQASGDGRVPPIPAIASHDPERLAFARAYAEKSNLPKAALEFQMLHGIRRDLQEQMVSLGYPVRVYVPFGTEWYPYYIRRLAERPANVWFFITNFFRK